MKTCPFCAEDIQDAAILCKHCGKTVPPARPLVPPAPPLQRDNLLGLGTPSAAEAADDEPWSPAAPEDRTHGKYWLGLLGILAVIGVWAACPRAPAPPAAEEVLLRVSAGRSPLAVSLTNQEDAPLRACLLRVIDAAGTTWSVRLSQDIAPRETLSVLWSDFHAAGQPMPGYIGRERGVLVACDVGPGGPRRTAGIGR